VPCQSVSTENSTMKYIPGLCETKTMTSSSQGCKPSEMSQSEGLPGQSSVNKHTLGPFCSPLGILANLELDLSVEWGIVSMGQEEVRSKLHLFGLCQFFATFHDWPQFSQMLKATGSNSRRNIPEASGNILGAANSLPGYKRCWCHGFEIGCGLIRSSRTC
jgi:hypothetical protein